MSGTIEPTRTSSAPLAPPPNPYVGPVPIQLGQPLYGRDTEVSELYHRLQARRIVVLHSPSGAGKSSLVNAGLIPRLKEEKFDVWKPIRVNTDPRTVLPRVSPEVNRYLLSALVSLEDELPKGHRRTPEALAAMDFKEYIQSRPRRKGREDYPIVLLFDQFEEVLTVAPREVGQKRDFFSAVGRALSPEGVPAGKNTNRSRAVWALFIIREDFLGALAPYRERIPTQMSNTFRLDLLDLAHAKQAAEQLARIAGRTFPGAEHLVRDLSTIQVQQADGSLRPEKGLYVEPVQLQVVCRRLWSALPKEKGSIEEADIEKYAEVSRALGGYYSEEVTKIARDALPKASGALNEGDLEKRERQAQDTERMIRDWIGSKLIVGGMRSQVLQELEKSAGLDNTLIAKLENSYLVRKEQRAAANWFELSHDRLVEPVLQENQIWEQAHLQWVQVQAKQWEREQRSPKMLLRSDALKEAEAWEKSAAPTEGEKAFLDESRKLRDREARDRRLRRVLGVLAVLTIVGTLSGGAVALWYYFQANNARIAAEISAVRSGNQKAKAEAATRAAMESQGAAEEAQQNAEKNAAAAEDAWWNAWWQEQLARDSQGMAEDARTAAERSADEARSARDDARESALIARAQEHLAAGEPRMAYALLRELLEWHPKTPAKEKLMTGILSGGVPKVTLRHVSPVEAASWSADDTRIATASAGVARIWDARGTSNPEHLDLPAEVRAVLFSPEAARVLVLPREGNVAWVWKLDGNKELLPLQGHTKPILFAAWSPDGNRVLTGSRDNTARVWSADGASSTVLEGHQGAVRCGAFSADGARVVTGAWDKTARVWRSTGEAGAVLSNHDGAVTSVGWNHSGTKILTTWENGDSVRVWGADEGKELASLEGHSKPITSAAWSPNEDPQKDRIVTASEDKTVRVWSFDDPKSLPMVFRGHQGSVLLAAWSLGGQRLLTTSDDGTARVWNANDSSETLTFKIEGSAFERAAWSRSGSRFLTVSTDGSVRVWNADDLKVASRSTTLPHPDAVSFAAFSPDGKRIATASFSGVPRIWDLTTDSEKPASVDLKRHNTRLLSASWSPSDKDRRLLTTSMDDVVRVWDLSKAEPAFKERKASSAAWSPDGSEILAIVNRQPQIWNADGSNKGEAIPLGPDVREVKWTPDGKQILALVRDQIQLWGRDGRLRQWKSKKPGMGGAGEAPPTLTMPWLFWVCVGAESKYALTLSADAAQIWKIDGDGLPSPVNMGVSGSGVRSVSWSPTDPRLFVLVTHDGKAQVWDVEGKRRGPAMEDDAPILQAEWSPDGTRIATVSRFYVVRVWSAGGTGKSTYLGRHAGAILSVGWNPKGTSIVTASADKTAMIWSFSVPNLKEPVRDCLDPGERVKLFNEDEATARRKVAECEKKVSSREP